MSNNMNVDLIDQLIIESSEIFNDLDNDDDMTQEQITSALKAQIDLIDKLELITNGSTCIS